MMIARHLVYSANVPGEIQGAMRQVCAIIHMFGLKIILFLKLSQLNI